MQDMDNLKLPAYPQLNCDIIEEGKPQYYTEGGFTKLELAALMIAQGLVMRNDKEFDPETEQGVESIALVSVDISRAILEEANK